MVEVAFIIPLKSRASSRNWELTTKSLNATLESLTAQTDTSYHILLICNDFPDLWAEYPNLDVVPTSIRIEGDFDVTKGRLDKKRKVLHGLIQARDHDPRLVMNVDSDDLLHRDIVRFAKQSQDVDGLIVNKGYRYRQGNGNLRKVLNYHLVSGSSTLFPYRASDLDAVTSHDDIEAHFISSQHHPKPAERIFDNMGFSYKYFPFYGGIYLQGHEHSLRDQALVDMMTADPERRQARSKLRYLRDLSWKVLGRVRGTRRIDDQLLEEFSGLSRWKDGALPVQT